MSLWKKYSDKLYLKQWSIGFLEGDIRDIIRQKKSPLPIRWMLPGSIRVSLADPFLFQAGDGQLQVLFESVSTVDLDGKITLMTIDPQGNRLAEKTLLETEAHLSYPFVFQENGKTYVFPENAFSGSLYCYEFDTASQTLLHKTEVSKLPLVDATLLKHDNRYWLFATQVGPQRNTDLYIFYADDLKGPFTAHKGNPVKRDSSSARPAGAFIDVDGQWYRPSQNCTSFYGESITINRIKRLDTEHFEEEFHFTLQADPQSTFPYGIHTINACGNTIVVDGQRTFFQPVQQLFRKMKSFLK